jgi:hypothetical protein
MLSEVWCHLLSLQAHNPRLGAACKDTNQQALQPLFEGGEQVNFCLDGVTAQRFTSFTLSTTVIQLKSAATMLRHTVPQCPQHNTMIALCHICAA